MDPFPHTYRVASETRDGNVTLSANNLPELATAAPAEFGGPGDKWSPETLLTGAIADCFVLGFIAIADASRVKWQAIRCDVEATLSRVNRVTSFTDVHISAHLTVGADVGEARAIALLEKAEDICLVTNSLKSTVTLSPSVTVA